MVRRRLPLLALLAMVLVGCTGAQHEVPSDPDAEKAFYETLDTPPAPVRSARDALATFALAPGYSISAVAVEPLIEDPVAADWDEAGRLYVAEMRAYMPDLEGTGEQNPIGAVVRLSDTDGDGFFDQRDELLNDLVLPRAVRIVNDGLLVAEMGKLWLCPTSSGWSEDIDCSRKRFLGVYGEHQGSVEHAENGLLPAMDNWLYSAKSTRRLKLVEGELIEDPTLFRGQWGIAEDPKGRLLYNTNSNLLLGDFFDPQLVVGAGTTQATGLGARVSVDDEVFSVRVNPGVNRAYVPGVLRSDGRLRSATSASGMVAYRGGVFDQAAPDAFVAEPAANLVAAFAFGEPDPIKLVAEHVLYPSDEWGQRDFLASTDERFRPVDVMNGPDGALYVVDFYRGVIQDHVFISEELKAQARARGLDRPLGMGRIWRVRSDGKTPLPRPDWQSLSLSELVAALSSPNVWRAQTAQRLLLRAPRGAADVALKTSLTTRGAGSARAVWLLKDRGTLGRADVEAALESGPVAAEAALRAGGRFLTVAALKRQASIDGPVTRAALYALGALAAMEDASIVPHFARYLVAHQDNPYLGAQLSAALRGREVKFLDYLNSTSLWSAEQEASTRFLKRLAAQVLRMEPGSGGALLDRIARFDAANDWQQRALLAGLFETTRDSDFERTQLAAAHPIFERQNDPLWPVIARARQAFTWPGDELAAAAKPLSSEQSRLKDLGRTAYNGNCANCHGVDGRGIGALGPPLAESDWVTGPPERLARIILQGVQGPIEVAGQMWNSAMPGHGHLPGFDDDTVSGLMTYLRRAWGHGARAIDPEFVEAVRSQTAERSQLWTAQELNAIELNTHFRKYEGRFGHPAQSIGFVYNGKDLEVRSGIFNGALLEQREDHFLFEPRQLAFEFALDDAGTVTGVILDLGSGLSTLPKLPDDD